MKRHSKELFSALLVSVVILFSGAASGWAMTAQSKPAEQEKEPEYSDEEYEAYDKASNEPDFAKRSAMLLAFIQKYPKSKLLSYVDTAYRILLSECSNKKNYALLEPLAEEWLKLHPKDIPTIAYVAEAAQNLGHDQKYVECLIAIYTQQPSATLAYDILHVYKKMKGQDAKYREWAGILFKYPECESDFSLRYDLVQQYVEAKDLAKASEYALLTLKAIDLVKQPDALTKDAIRKVRYACYYLIGTFQFDKDKYQQAMEAFRNALKVEKRGEAWYYIGMCQWKAKEIEEALLSFAKSELLGGETKAKAKENLEQLYKSLHDNTLVGINNKYKLAKEELAKTP